MSKALAKYFLKTISSKYTTAAQQVRLGSTYKAATLKEAGQPLAIEEKPIPKLTATQVRIQTQFCSVNSVDCLSFSDSSKKLPFVPGYELSGEVIEVGKDVSKEQILCGEKVAALSLEKFGGFSEQCVIDINDVWRLPSNVSRKDAAVLICGHSEAVYAFSNFSQPKEGDHVIVTAGPAGLGLAAVDVAANVYKAKVTGVVDSEERGELLRQRGAFQTVKFSEKLQKDVFKKTEGKGASIVYDAVGEHMLESIGSCVSTHGKIIHAAPFIYKSIPAPPPNSWLSIISLHSLRNQDLELYRSIVSDTLELADEEVISAHISAVFTLEKVNDAIEYITSKKCTGKVLIEIEED